MKKAILFLLLFVFADVLPAAVVDTITVHAAKMNEEVKVVVVMPSLEGRKMFPVLYLLHGYKGNETTWARMSDLSELADQYGMIIVCPDGKNSWYWDSPRRKDSQYETFLSRELVNYVDNHYPTVASREGRAVTGFSMGGHGALWNAIRHPEVFGAAGSMSGGVDIRPFPNEWEMKKQLGERDLNPLMWDSYTVINQIDRLRDGELALAFECGVDDFFYSVNNALHEALLARKIRHDYTVRPGKHDGLYWQNAIYYQMLFFQRYFEKALLKK